MNVWPAVVGVIFVLTLLFVALYLWQLAQAPMVSSDALPLTAEQRYRLRVATTLLESALVEVEAVSASNPLAYSAEHLLLRTVIETRRLIEGPHE